MRRLCLLALCLWFLLVIPLQAQEEVQVYLPIISKGNCMGLATLAISDGTTEISLLNLAKIHLREDDGWTPRIIQAKGGGVFQDSSLAEGRRLVYRQFGTAREQFNFEIMGASQDGLIANTAELLQLLEKAVNYWDTDWQNTPVYLIAQSDCETYARYALILDYSAPELQNPYAEPFIQQDGAIFDDITISIERGHWLGDIPTSSTCTQTNTIETTYQYEWNQNTAQPTAGVFALIELASGFMIAGDFNAPNGIVWRNNTGGAAWTQSTTHPLGLIYAFTEQSGWAYSIGAGGVYRSNDNGNNWALRNANLITGTFHSIIAASDGYLYAQGSLAGIGGIHRSNDGGATWATVFSTQLLSTGPMMQASDGYIYAARNTIWRSNDGTTWENVFPSSSPPTVQFWKLLETNNYLFAFGENPLVTEGLVYRSDDDGATWRKVATMADTIYDALEPSTGSDLLVSGGVVGASKVAYGDSTGTLWSEFLALTGTNERFFSLVEFSGNGDVYAGEDSDIFRQTVTEITTGRAATCNNEVYIANKQNISQLTDIFIFDATGASYTSQFPAAAFPFDLFPDPAAVGDITYFGIDSSVLDSGPFASLVFDIGTRLVAHGVNTFVWEYSQGGAAWAALSVQDNTDSVYPFDKGGVNSVHWEQPADWVEDAVNGVTALWVRLRITAVGTWVTTPTQQNRDVYTALLPRFEVGSTGVSGDIPALMKLNFFNQSDTDGRGGSAPNLYENRIICGLRSYDGAELFQAYINIANEQNPSGVVVSTGTNTAFANDVQTPTGRRATYNPAGVEAMATRATISFGSGTAQDFYGTFHAFLRVQRTSGASTDFNIRLVVVTGSGGIQTTTGSVQVQTTTAFELLDFGQVIIPAGGGLAHSDLGDQFQILIQASAANGTPNLNLYDLILIPVDEWAIDSTDRINSTGSIIGRSDSIAKLLDVDSITDPKNSIKSLVRQVDSDFVVANYNPVTNGLTILQANAQQRMWFLVAQTSATGSSYSWIAPHEIVHSVQVYKAQRYLGLRGAN